MTTDLKPCPFCGAAGQISRDSEGDWEVGCAEWITCPYSPAEIFNTEAEAIAAWNTRADDTRIAEAARQEERARITEGVIKAAAWPERAGLLLPSEIIPIIQSEAAP